LCSSKTYRKKEKKGTTKLTKDKQNQNKKKDTSVLEKNGVKNKVWTKKSFNNGSDRKGKKEIWHIVVTKCAFASPKKLSYFDLLMEFQKPIFFVLEFLFSSHKVFETLCFSDFMWLVQKKQKNARN
jgi:hypothetical protein